MINFDFVLMYPKVHKQDVMYHNGIEIHYRIISNNNHTLWAVLVTTANRETGQVIPRQDLTKLPLQTYGQCLEYVRMLPTLLDTDTVKTEHINLMQEKFERIKQLSHKLQQAIIEFESEYVR